MEDQVGDQTGGDESVEDAAPASPAAAGAESSRWQRAKGRYGDARDHAAVVADRVVAARPETPVIDTGFELYERDSRIAGGMLAGAIAFRLFLLLVPLLLVLVAGLGFLHVSEAERTTSEGLGLSESLISTMSTVGANAARGRWVTLWVGLVATVLAMRTLIKSLRIVHNLAWGTDRRPGVNRPVDLAAGMGVLVLVLGYILGAQWLRAHTPGGGLVASVATGAGAGLLWFLAEQLLPRAEGSPWWSLVPGAVLVAVLTQALHAVTVFYFAGRVDRMSETYGPLGIAIVALLWLYLLGRMMVAAAVLNAGLWDRRARGVAIWSPVDMALFRRR